MQITLLQAVIIGLWTAFCYSGMLWGIFYEPCFSFKFRCWYCMWRFKNSIAMWSNR